MPSKNLSVRESDEELWIRAEQRAKTSSMSLSSLVAQALAMFLGDDSYEPILVRVAEGRQTGFRGRWLVGPSLGVAGVAPVHILSGAFGAGYPGPFVAETARGRIAIWIPAGVDPAEQDGLLLDYDTLDEAAERNPWASPALWENARQALTPATWRDI